MRRLKRKEEPVFQTDEERAEAIRTDPVALKKILARQFRRITRARQSLPDFFEYVMREEVTRKRLICAQHQRVALSFVQAHPMCILMMPPGHSKTFMMASVAMFLMGLDNTLRGTVISDTQGQAEKPLQMVKGYIEESAELKAVFPRLRQSFRKSDPWTQTKITIDRPASVRDATLSAIGIDGAIDGSRLNFILVDDILSEENTRTKESRDKTYSWVQKSVTTRLDPRMLGGMPARFVLTNTAWHPEDVPHRLKGAPAFLPCLRMSIRGDIFVEGRVNPDWAVNDEVAALVRPSIKRIRSFGGIEVLRLVAHDPDPNELQTLWPSRVSREEMLALERGETGLLPQQFKQLYEQECRDDGTALCKIEYVETCKDVGRSIGHHRLLTRWNGTGTLSAVCGVDLSTGEGNDFTAFFTFYVNDAGQRIILDIDFGKWDVSQIVQKFKEKNFAFNPIFRVEDNGTQKYIKQLLLNENASFPIVPHTTDATKKRDPHFGVQSIFLAMKNGAWAIPNDEHGRMSAKVQRFVEDCLYYNPSKHTSDVLMACHLACAQAHEWGLLAKGRTQQNGGGTNVAMDLLSR